MEEVGSMRYRWVLIAAVAAALLTAGGVATAWSRGGDLPGPARTTSAPPPSSPVPQAPASSSADRENADRGAVEAAWVRFLDVYDAVESQKYPQEQWPTVVGAVAVDPTYSQVLRAAARFQAAGLAAYGTAVSHPYWTEPIGGKPTARMWDCMDNSRHGSVYVKSGEKRSVGVARDKTRATLVRGADGRWRVKLIEYFVSQKC
jgi:hypothetical protein